MLQKVKMLSLSVSFPLFFVISCRLLSVSAMNSIVYVKCSEVCFSPMTPYQSNLNSLLVSLLDSTSISDFYNLTISPQSNTVYGIVQCQADLSYSDCRDCVASSLSQLKATCPLSMSGTIQLDGCYVKYDNQSFFGVEDKTEVFKTCGASIGYGNPVSLDSVDDALAGLIVGNGQYFRMGGSGSVQGVAQCVQDLSLSECEDCILEARGRLRSECEASTWGDMYLGKCYIRYADHGYDYNHNNNNGFNDDDDDDGQKRGKKLAIIIGSSVGVAILIIGVPLGIYFRKRGNKSMHAYK